MGSGQPRILSTAQEIALTAGQSAVINTTELRNPFASGMWMYSMRFQFSQTTLATLRAPLVEAQFWMGKYFFMAGTVPVYVLDRIYNPFTDMAINTCGPLESTDSEVVHPNYLWKFQKPLYVPEGGVVVAKLFNNSTVTIGARLGYVCQEAPGPVPPEWCIPFAASYTAPGGIGGAALFTDVSAESDLVNPYDEPVFVRRMVGRIARDRLVDAQYFNQALVGSALQLRMTSSSGRAVLRDSAPFTHVFPPTHKQWLTNSVLPPQGYYVAAIEQNYASFGALSANTFQPIIGMSGYRKVRAQP